MGGKKAARSLLGRYPDAMLVASSGYSDDPVMANHTEFGFPGVIKKPCKIEEFAKTVPSAMSTIPNNSGIGRAASPP